MLRTIKYGETSIIAAIYTELFGLQSYIINGVRSTSKKGSTKAVFFQPAAILEMVVYYNEFRQLQRIKEYKFAHFYEHIFTDVIKNGVAMFMMELLAKSAGQPENNPDVYEFTEDSLLHLDAADDAVMANFAIFYALHLAGFFGFAPRSKYIKVLESTHLIFDLQEGIFNDELPQHSLYLEEKYARVLAALLQVRQADELSQIRANAETRRRILEAMETYFSLHIQDFGRMKTLPVLKSIMQ